MPHPATLSPVTIGLISDGGSGTVGTAPLVEQGARMAVAYQNAYGDGLEGHRIDLYICENDETPAGGQACANDMVQRGVAAVIEPFTGQGQTEVPTVVKAGIPYITMSGGSTAELTTPGAFALQGGFPAILGAAALQAKQQGYKKVAFLVANVPSVVQATQVLGGLVFKAAGVGFQVVAVNSGTADMSPQLQAAVAGGASAVGEAGDVTFCGSFLRAYASLNLHLPRYVVATCLDPSILNSPSLDKVMKGSWLAGAGTASPSNDALYAAIVHKYAPKVNPNPNASRERPRRHAAGALARGHHEGLHRAGDRVRDPEADRGGQGCRPADVRERHLHLRRRGDPAAQVRVLVDGGDRRARQRVPGQPHQGLRPDAALLAPHEQRPGPRGKQLVTRLFQKCCDTLAPGTAKWYPLF